MHTKRVALICLAILSTSATASAQETVEPVPESAWDARPFRVEASIAYPHVLHVAFGYSPAPRWRVSASFDGLVPFLFGGGLHLDFLLYDRKFGRNGWFTARGGLQSLVMKYNFDVVGIQPNDVDWGLGPDIGIDVGIGWFSVGAGVGVMVGDWRSLRTDIAPDVTPSDNLVVTFTVPRLAVNW